MVSRSIRHRLNEATNIWPGFVDVLATLLIVIIFILMVFTVSQIYLSDAILGRDKALESLKNQINELSKILIIESKDKQKVLMDLSESESRLKTEQELTQNLETQITEEQKTISLQNQNILLLSGQIEELLTELKIVAKALETYEGIEITSLDTKGLGERINKALASKIDELNYLNGQLSLTNQKLLISQGETSEQLEIVKQLNLKLATKEDKLQDQIAKLAVNEDKLQDQIAKLAVSEDKLQDQIAKLAVSEDKLQDQIAKLAVNEDKLQDQIAKLAVSEDKLQDQIAKLAVNEDKLQDQIDQYQRLTNDLIAINESLGLEDASLMEQLEAIKNKNLKLANLNRDLIEKDTTIFDLRDKILQLNNILSLNEKNQLTQETNIIDLDKKIQLLESEKKDFQESSDILIAETEKKSNLAFEQINSLSIEIDNLKNEISVLNLALEASEQSILTKELKIEVLGERLNTALTSKVFELQKYRSEFFGRLKSILGDRQDVKVVGDRFIFESELLFDSGSASLRVDGKKKLKEIGLTLRDTTKEIPEDIDWIIQVEGHTDNIPIQTIKYPSNWELSTARANSVLKLLLDLGFAPDRLSAAGYGEFYPISDGDDPIDLQQNRRIELKLTSR